MNSEQNTNEDWGGGSALNEKLGLALKPCPFCGGDAEIDYDPLPTGQHYRYSVYAKHRAGCYFLSIDSPLFESSDEVITAWDTRAPNVK